METSVEASSLGGQPSQAYNEMTEQHKKKFKFLNPRILEEGNIKIDISTEIFYQIKVNPLEGNPNPPKHTMKLQNSTN